MTPRFILEQRSLDPFWVAAHRDRSRRALVMADRYAFKAELAFESAAYYARDHDQYWFEYELNLAFDYLRAYQRARIDARRHALMAIRAVDLERWSSARAEIGRVRRGEARYRGECLVEASL